MEVHFFVGKKTILEIILFMNLKRPRQCVWKSLKKERHKVRERERGLVSFQFADVIILNMEEEAEAAGMNF